MEEKRNPSTFASFFVGWLGLLMGVVSCWGYRIFRGRRSTGFAMVTVVLSSMAALFLTELASWMYVLCTDPGWQRSAYRYGVPVARLALESLMMPENWSHILPNMVMGMFIGLLGVLSARRSILGYTDPEKAAQLVQVSAAAQQPLSTGLLLPREFTVRPPKGGRILWAVLFVLFLCLLAFSIWAFLISDMLGMIIFALAFYGSMAGLSLYQLLASRNRRLVVEGEELRAYDASGKCQAFLARDITGVSIAPANRTSKLYGREGQVLFKVQNNLENQPLLMQYLAEHHVPLRAK